MTLAATAQRLIEANGEAVVFMAPATTPAFNPVTGAPQTPVAPDPVTGSGVPTRYKAHEVDGSTILAEDVRLLVGVGGPYPRARLVRVSSRATASA